MKKDLSRVLNIGLIVDSNISSPYVYEIAEWAKDMPNINVSNLIIQEKASRKKRGKISRILGMVTSKKEFIGLLEGKLFDYINKMEAYFLKKDAIHNNHYNSFDLKKIVPHSLIIRPKVSKSGHVYRYSKDDVQRVKDLNLDILIRCGSGILRGEILHAAKFGILSFHHADNKINRGGPAGFWEVFHQLDSTGFIIQKLTEELDGGEVLMSGSFQTQSFYQLNQAALYRKSNHYLLRLLEEIAATGALPVVQDSVPYYNRLYTRPNLFEQLIYLKNFLAIKLKGYNATYVQKEKVRWAVAYNKSDWTNLVMWRSIKIPNPPFHFLADPFVVNENGRDYCFLEDYDFKIGRAGITVYELKDKSAERLGEVITEPFHLSFPYAFRYGGKLYMCPESNENKDIRIYECTDFPLKWELTKVVMRDVNAVDTMFFEKDGRWWMFTNMAPKQSEDLCNELYIFHADSPLSDNWIPHKKNPIFFDALKARNAGIVTKGDALYRVSQRQGFNQYGKSFSVNKIVLLTSDDYIEQEVASVGPHFFPKLKGTHHLHSSGGVTVFDYNLSYKRDK